MTAPAWTVSDRRALLDLLAIDTTTPMETGVPSAISTAQQWLACHAAAAGFETVHFAAPADPGTGPEVPRPVRAHLAAIGPVFLDWQPNLVLRLGPVRAPARTLLFNVHMDTVAPFLEPRLAGGTIHGRGVADAKGLGVAVLAGVRAAFTRDPGLRDRISVLLQSPAGEEGGAMGIYGTRALVAAGFVGGLNVVCEPTSSRALTRSTTSMTARIEVTGVGATDDEPERGENATLLLGWLASDLAARLSPRVADLGGRFCLAGLHTGHSHNRVFGTGHLLVNLAYTDVGTGEALRHLVTDWFTEALGRFRAAFGDVPAARATAAAAERIARLGWDKTGLPVLNRAPEPLQALFAASGIDGAPSGAPTFTCDAMWFQEQLGQTCILGPGGLGENGAHTDRERLAERDLAGFAETVSDLCRAFDTAGASL
jgi:acetylornithine deacetylase